MRKYPKGWKARSLLFVFTLVFIVGNSVSAQQAGGGLRPDTANQPQQINSYSLTERDGKGLDLKTSQFQSLDLDSGERLASVIVSLQDQPLAAYDGGLPGLAPTNPRLTGHLKLEAGTSESRNYLAYLQGKQKTFEADLRNTLPSAQVLHHYLVTINGLSLVLPASQVQTLGKMPGVDAIYPDKLVQIDTDASPGFINAPAAWSQLGGPQSAGEGVVIGVIDTGVWPEHPSLADPDPSGKLYPPPPGGEYPCQFGSSVPGDLSFTCNHKLIGAYRFMSTYDFAIGLQPGEFPSVRDSDGHGTHTSTTAAGNAGVTGSIMGSDLGLVSGIAPRAQLIAYKVCGGPDGSCYQSDSVSAIDQAVLDGVDVINYSIGGGLDPYEDAVELSFLGAYKAGVFVSAAAGNNGPDPDTVIHRAPWVTSVAASTQARTFVGQLHLISRNDSLDLTGVSITGDYSGAVVLAADFGDGTCGHPFPAGTWTHGEIVVCARGGIARVEKSFNVKAGGAGGMVLYNPTLQGLNPDNHYLPTVHLEVQAGLALLDFMADHSDVNGTIVGGIRQFERGDSMAVFSARGGPEQTLGISKPDISAPGVEILAGHTPQPAFVNGGAPGQLFQVNSGTSMSTPHLAGSAALMKAMHPGWTPGQIKSALMTSARVAGMVKEDGVTPVTPFDDGSGRLDLSIAGEVGLTFDEIGDNFMAFKDQLWMANYPSLYLPTMPGAVVVDRTVHSELDSYACWRTSVEAPPDVTVRVPPKLCLPAGGEKTFHISLEAGGVPIGQVRHARLYLQHGQQVLNFPITIVRRQPPVTLEKACMPGSLAEDAITQCSLKITNLAFESAPVFLEDFLPRQLDLEEDSVVGGGASGNLVYFQGTLSAAQPIQVRASVSPQASPVGYLPLGDFNPTQVIASDESITNYLVPAFKYAGEIYHTIGIVSNGYIVVGGGDTGDVDFLNTDLPDSTLPNNLLAPFWTDLNPGAGGRVMITTVTDGLHGWIVVEWEAVLNFRDHRPNTFQVWIEYNGEEQVSFTYGPEITSGDNGFLTVGAENQSGISGQAVYFNGVGATPQPSFPNGEYEVAVFSQPGGPGGVHEITYQAEGQEEGEWTNCAALKSEVFFGVNLSCFSGVVTPEDDDDSLSKPLLEPRPEGRLFIPLITDE